MPRYFSQTSDREFPQDEGVDLKDPEHARNEAIRAAGEILHDLDGALWRAGEWRMQVTDAEGRTVCLLTFTAVKGEI